MSWVPQRLRAMQTGNARQLAAEPVVEAACCRACCQMTHILVQHAKASYKSYKRLKAATWFFPAHQRVVEYAWLCLPVLLHAEDYLFLSFAASRNAYQLLHACIQLSSPPIVSYHRAHHCRLNLEGRKNNIIQMSITQQSMDTNEDYLHCAFRSHARPGFTCLGGSGGSSFSRR